MQLSRRDLLQQGMAVVALPSVSVARGQGQAQPEPATILQLSRPLGETVRGLPQSRCWWLPRK